MPINLFNLFDSFWTDPWSLILDLNGKETKQKAVDHYKALIAWATPAIRLHFYIF